MDCLDPMDRPDHAVHRDNRAVVIIVRHQGLVPAITGENERANLIINTFMLMCFFCGVNMCKKFCFYWL